MQNCDGQKVRIETLQPAQEPRIQWRSVSRSHGVSLGIEDSKRACRIERLSESSIRIAVGQQTRQSEDLDR